MFCFQWSTSHPLFQLSVTSSIPCFTLVFFHTLSPKNLNMILQVWLHQKGSWKVLLVVIGFSKVQDQTLCFLVNLCRLQSSIKNQHLQSSIKSTCCEKLSLTSQSLHLFGTHNSILVRLPLQIGDHFIFKN